ncbi:MAG: ectonucleotide pyrophosphatase/phosphodiesterase [Opitutaceae bacterium]|nr:ectonucleotide pyrophosphatase/phosphodiesterase [Opitutaceae bacterium]
MKAGIAAWLGLVAVSRALAIDAPLILVSLDGFRWDYCELHPAESLTLRELKRDGVSARGLIPVFPSNTFPNHYSIVTGLYPARHGIVNNDFFDPVAGMFFRFNQPNSVRDSRWWAGEPVWVTAEKQGRKAAAAFWVGSEAAIQGVRPSFWRTYDNALPFERRLAELIGWMKLPATERPAFVAFYIEETNGAGHAHGPDSPQVAAAIKLVDGRLATLLHEFRQQGIEPNLIVVSDHGMTSVDRSRIVVLDDFIEHGDAQIDFDGSVVGLRPRDGEFDSLRRKLERIPHARVYSAEELPAHFRLRNNPRIPPLWILPEEGVHVVTRATFERLSRRYSARGYLPGDHGYDPSLPSMQGVFIAHGPAFRHGVEIPAVENVHLYNLMCSVLGLKAAPNDGDDRLVHAALRPATRFINGNTAKD